MAYRREKNLFNWCLSTNGASTAKKPTPLASEKSFTVLLSLWSREAYSGTGWAPLGEGRWLWSESAFRMGGPHWQKGADFVWWFQKETTEVGGILRLMVVIDFASKNFGHAAGNSGLGTGKKSGVGLGESGRPPKYKREICTCWRKIFSGQK